MHQRCDFELEDLWAFHEPGEKRHVTKVLSLCHYALSPSTKEVLLFPDAYKPEEVRAYGSRGEMVWYDIPPWTPMTGPFVYSMLGGLLREMERAKKLGVG